MAVDIPFILNQWEAIGFFDYVLPFLLIFAVIFGILQSVPVLGSNRGVHVIVALVIGLLALRLGFVQEFYREVFPRVGVGIAILLIALILIGLFIANNQAKYWMWGLGGLGILIFLVIMSDTFDTLGYGNFVWQENISWILGLILLIGIIIAVSSSRSQRESDGTFIRWENKPVAVSK